MKLIGIALIGMLASGMVIADVDLTNGTALLQNCKNMIAIEKQFELDRLSVLGAGQCLGVVQGVRNTLVTLANAKLISPVICFPGGGVLSNGQTIRVVVKYLEDNPKDLNLDQSLLTMMALLDAFPCKS
ncbi:hypothetical protein HZF02_23820 [Pseudomonas yamanorum]|nr:hypothetical protein HZF02_23820 [Pseudomonas yamanorum]